MFWFKKKDANQVVMLETNLRRGMNYIFLPFQDVDLGVANLDGAIDTVCQ